MSFLFILSKEIDIIDFAREKSDRYSILNEIVNNEIIFLAENQLYLLNIDKSKLENTIVDLLKDRNLNIYNLDYKNRFQDDEIFTELKFNNKTYSLCNSGFDNQISFLINIFNYIENVSNEVYMLKAKNHKIFKTLK